MSRTSEVAERGASTRNREMDRSLPDLDPAWFDPNTLKLSLRAGRAFIDCHGGNTNLAFVEIVRWLEYVCDQSGVFKRAYRRLDSGFHRVSWRQVTLTLTPDLAVVSAYANRTPLLPCEIYEAGEVMSIDDVSECLDPRYVRITPTAMAAFAASQGARVDSEVLAEVMRETLCEDWETGEWSATDVKGGRPGDRYYINVEGRRWIVGGQDGTVIAVQLTGAEAVVAHDGQLRVGSAV